MKHRILSTAVLTVASLLRAQAAFAASAGLPLLMHAMVGKTKLITFSLRNDSAMPLRLKAGDTAMTIEAGKTVSVKLPAGTSVITEEATPTHPAGSVIAQVSSQLSGATLSIR